MRPAADLTARLARPARPARSARLAADRTRHVAVCIALTLGVLVAGCTTRNDPPPPALTTDASLAPVIAELRTYVAMSSADRAAFTPTAATSAQLGRLLAATDIAQLPVDVRRAAVNLAGPLDTVLMAERPSDVLARMRHWFPEGSAADAGQRRLADSARYLLEPAEGWSTRSLAFAALWQCLPKRVWIWPDGMPADGHVELAGWPLAANSSAPEESEFGHCMRQRLVNPPAFDERQLQTVVAMKARLAKRSTPVLQSAFARMLTGARCDARGADDCVTIAAAWASLSPDDPELARALQRLDAAVAPDAPLPAALRPYRMDAEPKVEDARDRYQAGLRRAAWLRARLHSIAHGPQAWSDDALGTTLAQLSRLRQDFLDPFVRHFYRFEIDYRNEPVNPWRDLENLPDQPRLREAVLAEIGRMDADPSVPCDAFDYWFKSIAPPLQTRHALAQLQAGGRSRCTAPEWDWLRAHPGPTSQGLLDGLAQTLGQAQGTTYDELVAGFTGWGEACFTTAAATRDPLTDAVCAAAVSEPQEVHAQRARGRLRLPPGERFLPVRPAARPSAPPAEPGDPQAPGLHDIVDALSPGLTQPVRDLLADLARLRLSISSLTGWRAPRGGGGLVVIDLFSAGEAPLERPWPLNGERLLLRIEPGVLTRVGIPGRFAFQYDLGRVTAVSDVDRDGHLEVWITGEHGECDGEGLRPGIDCAVKVVHLGEIRGDALSWFVRGPGPTAETARR